MTILVTGGAGYIGSHTVVELLEAGYEVVVFDNLSNSKVAVFDRIRTITGTAPHFVEGDIRNPADIDGVLSGWAIEAVIHFAGLKAVGESVSQPLRYYENNVSGTINLLQAMQRYDCNKMVFSSSATVYGDPDQVPVTESSPLRATNPYGQTKLDIENILRDLAASDPAWQVMLLRYFNPVGAHPSGLIGEDPNGIPNNLMPFVAQVAVGRQEKLRVFGGDYPTADGTGVRDYIHVSDLAEGHLAALRGLRPGCDACNLGTGNGYSVLEVVAAFGNACGKAVAYEVVDRRPGDSAVCFADTAYSGQRLQWRAIRGLDQMVADHWRWQERNPHGYPDQD
jgi:UDP-glucose 4-epimerase